MPKARYALLYVAMVCGYSIAMGVFTDTPYHPWAIDLHHLSAAIAFACAAGCGFMLARS